MSHGVWKCFVGVRFVGGVEVHVHVHVHTYVCFAPVCVCVCVYGQVVFVSTWRVCVLSS